MRRYTNLALCGVLAGLTMASQAGAAEESTARAVAERQAKPQLKVQGPTLSVKTIAVAPVSPGGWVERGQNVRISVEVANAGPTAALGTEPIQLQCTVKSGGQCPVPSSTKTVGKPIPPGSSRSFTVISATPAQAGMYEVKAAPVGGGRGSGFSVEIQVGGQVSKGLPGQKILMPGQASSTKPVLPGEAEGFSPKPEPPRVQAASRPTLPGEAEGFSPKPEPPRVRPADRKQQ